MKSIILYQTSTNHYLFIDMEALSSLSVEPKKYYFNKNKFQMIETDQIIKKKDLRTILGNDLNIDESFYYAHKNDTEGFFLFIPLNLVSIMTLFITSKRINQQILNAQLILKDYIIKQYNEILIKFIDINVGTKDCIDVFAKFVHCEKFSLWIYNPSTEYFCCAVSSHRLQKEFVNKDDNSSLYDFYSASKSIDIRKPNRTCINSKFGENMETLNRIRLNFSNGEVGILDILSSNQDFVIKDDHVALIKRYVELKYLEFHQKTQQALHELEKYFSTYKSDKLYEFLYGLTNLINTQLNFQACSIFLKKKSENVLELVAVSDKQQHGKPQKQIEYNLTKTTFTGTVYNLNKVNFSYDIANDQHNSHTYDEATEGTGKTWIALPLYVESNKFGVLRVKNKQDENDKQTLTNFHYNDFLILDTVCTHLSNILQLHDEREKLQSQSNLLSNKLNDLTNFYNTFLHEIRTPISTFNLLILRIKTLIDEQIINRDAIKLKLDDIRMMADRLTFIVNTYYFNQLVEGVQQEELSVLKDIVFPVLSISRDYIKKQYDVGIDLVEHELISKRVYGDKIHLQIVFNILISNAGKYSPHSKHNITISGESDIGGNYYIIVSNYGLPINDDEREKIFENRIRGEEPKKQKIGGTGIGLYLAKQIMLRQGGDLLLTSCNNPTTFKIKIREKLG